MKLFEIFKEDTDKLKLPQEITDWLNNSGYKKIGSGQYGEVFSKDNNSVLKVLREEDPCYEKFIQFVSKNKNNKNLPTILWKENYEKDGQTFLMVEMEKLENIDGYELIRNADPEDLYAYLQAKKDFQRKWASDIEDHLKDEGLWDKFEGVDPNSLNFYKTMKDLIAFVDRRCWVDLHNKNVMMRKDGTLVLTDPFSSMNYWD